MIVKIKSEKDCWSYCDGDNLVQHKIYLSNTNANSYPGTLFFLTEGTKINQKEKLCICGKMHNFGLFICVQQENRVIARIITNRSTYLMNDNGKTVDKLY